MKNKNNYKLLSLFIIIPLLLGIVSGLLTVPGSNIDSIIPSWIFPIVWSILYILMGISSYLVFQKESIIPKIYLIQLLFNYLWVFIFFDFKYFTLSFIWIIILIILVIIMIKKFYQIDKTAGYLQIPYLIWLIIAAILNFQFII